MGGEGAMRRAPSLHIEFTLMVQKVAGVGI